MLDFDGIEAALALIGEWEQLHGAISTRAVLSGSGHGLHLHFAHPGYEVRNRSYASIKVDVRGDGGYAVLPPSMHSSGNRYRLLDEDVLDVAELPDGFLEFLETKAGVTDSVAPRRGRGRTGKPTQTFAKLHPTPDYVLARIAERAERQPRPSAAIPATASFDLILRRCEQMRHFYKTGCSGEHEEPAWKGAAGVLAFCADGERIFHERSELDGRYDRAETQAKFDTRKGLDGRTIILRTGPGQGVHTYRIFNQRIRMGAVQGGEVGLLQSAKGSCTRASTARTEAHPPCSLRDHHLAFAAFR